MEKESGKSKYYILMEKLKEEILSGRIRAGEKLPSENELSVQYGLSRHTVRKALSILENEGYVTAYHGRGTFCSERMIQRHNSKNIAVVTTYISDYIFPRLIQGMDRVLTASGYSIILKNTGNSRTNEAKVLQELLNKPIDGLIIEPSKSQILCRHLNLYQILDQYEIPYVFIQGRYPQLTDKPHILMDDCKGGYLLTRYLIEKGHRKIAGVFKADDSQGAQRHLGYTRALNEAGIAYDPELVVWFHTEDRKQKPGLMMKLFLETGRVFDAVVCYNDQIAIQVMDALRREGVRIPEDVSVTGYDNSAMAKAGEIGLTTIAHPQEKLGEMAAELILEKIRKVPEEESKVGRLIQPELIIRESVAENREMEEINMSMDKNAAAKAIESGKTALGIEFGSTRIKAVLVGEDNAPVASGAHEWENRYENGIWTYTLEDIWGGLQDCYQQLAADVKAQYGITLKKIGAIGFSAMMHGYMAFNKQGELLVPFRTWRNSITEEASEKLTELFQYNIPQRWSIAHLYQAILNQEAHVPEIDFITTLDGYIHWKLTGERTLGVGEASGMFPIDPETKDYRRDMVEKFEALIADKKYPWKLSEILPKVLVAGEHAGVLSEEGAKLLDVSGNLEAGIPLCPSEGDAGTGMVATNSVAKRTGNVSAGTSVFAMIVLEKELSNVYPEIDMVTTPTGNLVAMVHANNCTSDLNAWVGIFKEFAEAFGVKVDRNELFGTLYRKALEGDPDCGGLLSYGYFSGENITHMEEGRPLFVRTPKSNFNLANFMRVHLFTALGALKVGMDILFKEENVQADKILGHGGLFKTKGVGQKIMAAALNTPVSVMETAGEGGAWGIALLASYMVNKEEGETLDDYLDKKVFAGNAGSCMEPDAKDVEGFEVFIERYKAGLPIERAAIDTMKL